MSQKGTSRVPLETLEAREKEMLSGRHSKASRRQNFFADITDLGILSDAGSWSYKSPQIGS